MNLAVVNEAVTDQVEGGQEVSQAAYLAYEASPVSYTHLDVYKRHRLTSTTGIA